MLFQSMGWCEKSVCPGFAFAGSRSAGVLAQPTVDSPGHKEQQLFTGWGLALQAERLRHGA